MNHCWLITWTCYGHWLPGDARGFVGNVRDKEDRKQVVHNIPGTPYDANIPKLEAWVRANMKGPPVVLGLPDAKAMIAQYQETARIRGWDLQAASVMNNHTHIVVEVPGDLAPKSVLETFKSWATRAVKKIRPLPPNGRFWTAKGSRRKLPDDAATRAAVIYVVKKQPNPLAVWYASQWRDVLNDWEAGKR